MTALTEKMNVTIKTDYLSGYLNKKESELGFEAVERYSFEGEMEPLKTYLKNTYAVYQLTENIEYEQHELFYWSNGDNFFTLNMNTDKLSKEQMESIHKDIIDKLTYDFAHLNIRTIARIDYVLDLKKIEDFLLTYQLDLDNLKLEKFRVITVNHVGFPRISDEAKKRLHELNKKFLQAVKGKRAIINGELEGTFKPYGDSIVFFKKRVRKSYYQIDLTNIRLLQLIDTKKETTNSNPLQTALNF